MAASSDDNEMNEYTRSTVVETRGMTIERLLNEFELCDVAGRLAIIEHSISKLQCTVCPVCTQIFRDDEYRVIPCLCRMHTFCMQSWLKKTKHSKESRVCPGCNTTIEDDGQLWHIADLREMSEAYRYGDDVNDEYREKLKLKNPTVDSDDESDTDEDSPKAFYPRAKVPPQSPRRRTKGKLNKMRRALTDSDLTLK